MAVESLARTAEKILNASPRTRQDKCSTTMLTALPQHTAMAKENKPSPSVREVVKKAKLRRERAKLVKHLYKIMETTRPTNYLDFSNLSDSETTSVSDEWLDRYDFDLKDQRRKATSCRRTKRERVPSKEKKFLDFCQEHQIPENITLERGRKKAIRVKFYECTKQMSRDSNCREQNLNRKANIENKLRKLGLKRLEECIRRSRQHDENHPAAEPFALREENVPQEMQDMVDFLLGLQDREITPEDYEFLLRLDESIPTKTVSEQRLASLRENTASEEHVHEVCGICMECYEVGQSRKILPCEHAFHSQCIDTWLGQSSTKCPLDGKEI